MIYDYAHLLAEVFFRKHRFINAVPNYMKRDPYLDVDGVYSPTNRIDNTDKSALCLINGFAEILEETYQIDLKEYLPSYILRDNLISLANLLQVLSEPARYQESIDLNTNEAITGFNKGTVLGCLKKVKETNFLTRTEGGDLLRDMTQDTLRMLGRITPPTRIINDLQMSFFATAMCALDDVNIAEIMTLASHDIRLSFPLIPDEIKYIVEEYKGRMEEGFRMCACLEDSTPMRASSNTNEDITKIIQVIQPYSELAAISTEENLEYFEPLIKTHVADFILNLGFDESIAGNITKEFMEDMGKTPIMGDICFAIALTGGHVSDETAHTVINLIDCENSGLTTASRMALIYDALTRDKLGIDSPVYDIINLALDEGHKVDAEFAKCIEYQLNNHSTYNRGADITRAINIMEFGINNDLKIADYEKWERLYEDEIAQQFDEELNHLSEEEDYES